MALSRTYKQKKEYEDSSHSFFYHTIFRTLVCLGSQKRKSPISCWRTIWGDTLVLVSGDSAL